MVCPVSTHSVTAIWCALDDEVGDVVQDALAFGARRGGPCREGLVGGGCRCVDVGRVARRDVAQVGAVDGRGVGEGLARNTGRGLPADEVQRRCGGEAGKVVAGRSQVLVVGPGRCHQSGAFFFWRRVRT